MIQQPAVANWPKTRVFSLTAQFTKIVSIIKDLKEIERDPLVVKYTVESLKIVIDLDPQGPQNPNFAELNQSLQAKLDQLKPLYFKQESDDE
jgi:hypothetical protein